MAYSVKRTPGMITIMGASPPKAEQKKKHKTSVPANVVTVQYVDIKKTRQEIFANWRAFTPAGIVKVFKAHYTNLRSASVMLSHLKKELAALDDPPALDYLDKLALSKREYNEIRQLNSDVRKRGALNVISISNSDLIVTQALQYVTSSSDPNLLMAALFPLTGLRPIEIARTARFKTPLNNRQVHSDFWACQTRFAKRGTMLTKYNECRDRPFLCPYYLIERALRIIRARWPCQNLTNREVSRKYSSTWQKILHRAYPMLPGVTAKLFRRFFAVYSFNYFGKSVFVGGESQSSLNGYASWVLGHAALDSQVIAYSSLFLRPYPKLKLFEVGRNLKVLEQEPKRAPKRAPKRRLDKQEEPSSLIAGMQTVRIPNQHRLP
jgi:hypothetical protein